MDLSPRQRRAVFALVVIVLAALGYYLIVPALRHSGGQRPGGAPPRPRRSATPAASAPAPAVTAPATAAGSVNIYTWLPFTQQDLAAAASVATRFSVDYDTFTYTESASAYVGAMGGLITGQLASHAAGRLPDPWRGHAHGPTRNRCRRAPR